MLQSIQIITCYMENSLQHPQNMYYYINLMGICNVVEPN
uniref:Uncharacterized protein n=1 Tax=Arundo donax TaxID=35708 RepID=A0A0A8ZY70_ARUDO